MKIGRTETTPALRGHNLRRAVTLPEIRQDLRAAVDQYRRAMRVATADPRLVADHLFLSVVKVLHKLGGEP